MPFTQTDRLMSIHTPLGEDALLLNGFSGNESISQLPKFDLDLIREGEPIAFQDIIGQQVTIQLVMTGDEIRYFNGFISRFVQTGSETGIIHYRAEMVPWLWFLTRTADCRIFQNKTVPDIIKQIFADLGFSDYKFQLEGTYQPREYCVQYRETDYNFVARLMEQYGLFYFFTHEENKHMLIVGDSPAAHPDHLGPETVSWEPTAHALEEDVITSLACEKDLLPGKFSHTDYNFTTPSNNLMAEEPSVVEIGGNSQYEIYDYPGEYEDRGAGATLAKVRMQEIEAQHFIVTGRSTCRGFFAGSKFTLIDYFPADLNQAYVLTSVQHVGSMGTTYSTASAGGSGGEAYSNSFSGIPLSVPFRPRQRTPKPIVQGPQTAKVVGPSGETIWPDEYGRIKVQFHWDREGQMDDNSSCWVRVSQNRAGKGWGESYIPHVGQEVIVSFLEGDPDRPIVTGRVYNAEFMPPVALPAGKTQLAMQDQGGNQIIMEGADGGQQIKLHSPHSGTTLTLGAPRNPPEGVSIFTSAFGTFNIGQDSFWEIIGSEEKNIMGNKSTNIQGSSSSTIFGSRKSKTLGWSHSTVEGLSTSINNSVTLGSFIGFKGDFSYSNSLELKYGYAIKHTYAGELELCPATKDEKAANFNADVGKYMRKAGSYSQKLGEANQKIASLQREVSSQNDKIGKFEQEVAGAFKLLAATINVVSKGAYELKTPKFTIDGKVIVKNDLHGYKNFYISGETIELG